MNIRKTTYLVRIEGRNISLRREETEEIERCGFVCTRYVVSTTEKGAATAAVEQVRCELVEKIGGVSLRDAAIECSEVRPLTEDRIEEQPSGFTFFPDGPVGGSGSVDRGSAENAQVTVAKLKRLFTREG